MSHLLVARCHPQEPQVAALVAALDALRVDEREPRITRLSLLDLGEGPTVGRVRAAVGIGWQARDRLRRVADAAGPVDAVVEACLCGRHHLLGLGRAGVPTVRWVPPGRGENWLDRAAAAEGSPLVHQDAAGADVAATTLIMLDRLEALRGPGPVRTSGKR